MSFTKKIYSGWFGFCSQSRSVLQTRVGNKGNISVRVRGGQEGSLVGAKVRCSGTQWGNEDHLKGEWISEEQGIQGDS